MAGPSSDLLGIAFGLMFLYGVLCAIGEIPLVVLATVKSLPILVLVLAAGPPLSRFASGIRWGLVLSSFGDFALDMMPTPGYEEILFKVGLVFFLLAHILYARGCTVPPIFPLDKVTPTLVVSFLFYGFLIALLALLLPYTPASEVAPVTVYALTICTMVQRGLLRTSDDALAYWLFVAGSLVFTASDSILAWDKFRTPVPKGKLWVMLTYYAAQVLICSAASFEVVRPPGQGTKKGS